MDELIIFGSGALAREAESIARRTHDASSLILQPLAPDEISKSSLEHLAGKDPAHTHVFAAIGMSALNYARFDLWAKLRLLGFKSVALVDPTATVDPSVKLQENTLFAAGVVVGADAAIGTGTIVQANACIQGGAKVGRFSWVGGGVSIGAEASIGDNHVLGPGVVIADKAMIGGQGEISMPGLYKTAIARGTFIASEFSRPVRLFGRY